MKELLLIDCCIRGKESRTRKLTDAFLEGLDKQKYHVTVVSPEAEGMVPLTGANFARREELVEAGELDQPRFFYAQQFAQADVVVFAAPMWELSFPAILKIYLENVSVKGITFGCDAQGLFGSCQGSRLVFLTTRGERYAGGDMEQGSRYLEAMAKFFGFENYTCIAADGLDANGADAKTILADACGRARGLAGSLG